MDEKRYYSPLDLIDHIVETKEYQAPQQRQCFISGKKQQEAITATTTIYDKTLGKISHTDSIILHSVILNQIMKWNQQNLSAYMASADVFFEKEEDPR